MSTNLHGPANRPIFDPAARRAARKVTSPIVTVSGGLAELPPFDIAGVGWVAFNADRRLWSGIYVTSQDIDIERIDWTLSSLDEVAGSESNRGIAFDLVSQPLGGGGETVQYASTKINSFFGGDIVSLSIAADTRLWVRLQYPGGYGGTVNLTVMCRLAQA